jgi:hypothetical protein
MKVVAEAQKAGVELTVADIFCYPRLAYVARQGLDLLDSSLHDIIPFSLLSNGFDVTLLLCDLLTQF